MNKNLILITMIKLIYFSILLLHVVKCEIYLLDDCMKIPKVSIWEINSNQRMLSSMNKYTYAANLSTGFDAEGTDATEEVIFEIIENNNGIRKYEYLKVQYAYLKTAYEYLHLTLNETEEECAKKIQNMAGNSFLVILTDFLTKVEDKLTFFKPMLSLTCTTYTYIKNTENGMDDFTAGMRKLLVYNVKNDSESLFETKNKTDDCTLQENILSSVLTNGEIIKCIAKYTPDDSFYRMLTKLQNDVELKLKYLQSILNSICTTYNHIKNTDSAVYTIPNELNADLRKLLIHNLIYDVDFKLTTEKKLKVFDTNDCALKDHVLSEILNFFDLMSRYTWVRITASLKIYTDQCLVLPEDIQQIKNKIPSKSIENIIFGDTVCLRYVQTNSYLKSVDVRNIIASTKKKITYFSNNNTFTIQNLNGKYMQTLTNRTKNIIGSHHTLTIHGYWDVLPVNKNNVHISNAIKLNGLTWASPRFLYINENKNAVLNTDKYNPTSQQWQVDLDCDDLEANEKLTIDFKSL